MERRFDKYEEKNFYNKSPSLHYYHFISIHHYDNTWKSKKDKIKKKMMQIGTRIIGEDNRARLVSMKRK